MMSSKPTLKRNLSIPKGVKQEGPLVTMRSTLKRSLSLRTPRDTSRKHSGECLTGLPKLKRNLSLRCLLKSQKSSKSLLTAKKQPRVVQLVVGESWGALRDFLSTDAGMAEASACVSPVNDSGDNILHLACRLRPPVDLVRKLIQANRDAVRQLNEFNQTPLHVAAACGASSQVVRLLVKRYREAAAMQDLDGKTPLHLTCENCSAEGTCDPGNGDDHAKPVKGPMLGVVKALCIAAPGCVNVEDEDEASPLEYAIFQGAEIEIVKALQKVSQRYWVASNKRKARTKYQKASSDLSLSCSTTSKASTRCSPHRVNPASTSHSNEEHPVDEMGRPAYLSVLRDARMFRSTGGNELKKLLPPV